MRLLSGVSSWWREPTSVGGAQRRGAAWFLRESEPPWTDILSMWQAVLGENGACGTAMNFAFRTSPCCTGVFLTFGMDISCGWLADMRGRERWLADVRRALTARARRRCAFYGQPSASALALFCSSSLVWVLSTWLAGIMSRCVCGWLSSCWIAAVICGNDSAASLCVSRTPGMWFAAAVTHGWQR